MNKSPCLYCIEKRKELGLYCHDICPEFQEYRKLIDKARAKRIKEMDVMGYTINNIYKFKKARNLGGRRI